MSRAAAALAVLLLLAGAAALHGCGGDDEAPAADGGGETAAAPAGDGDGDGMEPRIVTEGPIDAPGRPAGDGPEAAFFRAEEEPAGATWVPHLAAADLDATVDFYRGLGFTIAGDEGEGAARRVELARDGARLVLRPAPASASGEARDEAAEETADVAGAETAPAPAVDLHLVLDEGGETRTVRDPDGRRVTLPAGG